LLFLFISTYQSSSYLAVDRTPTNDYEQKQCNAKLCAQNRQAYDEYPARVWPCKRTLKACKGPVKTAESICNLNDMGQPVKYDSLTGICSIESSVDLTKYGPRDRKAVFTVTLVLNKQLLSDGPLIPMESLRFTCDHFSEYGQLKYLEKISRTKNLYVWGNRDTRFGLTNDKSVIDGLPKTAKQACDLEQHSFGHETIFPSEKSKDALFSF